MEFEPETGRKPLGMRALYGMMGALSFMQPKSTLTENVLAETEGREEKAS